MVGILVIALKHILNFKVMHNLFYFFKGNVIDKWEAVIRELLADYDVISPGIIFFFFFKIIF